MNKKICYLFIVLGLVILTGCGKKEKLTCTNEQKFGTAVLKTETIVTYKKDKKVSSNTTMEASFTSEETAKTFANNYKDRIKKDDENDDSIEISSVKQDKTKVTVKTKETEKSIKESILKKEEEKEQLEKIGFECK